MDTVRGDTRPQYRPFQTVQNYQVNRRKITANAEIDASTFDDSQVSSPKQIANYFNIQYSSPQQNLADTPLPVRPG